MSPQGLPAAASTSTDLGLAAPPVGEAQPVHGSHHGHHGHHHPKAISPTVWSLIGWVRWAVAQPAYDGPISDPNGENCALGQQGPVWYLAGTWGGPVERTCDIPLGKHLVFPLVNNWCVFPDEYYASEEEIEETIPLLDAYYAEQYPTICSLTLRVDGQDLRPDLESLREDTYIETLEPFEVELNEAHWAPDYFEGGVMPAIGFGHYAKLKPLPPGDHVIEFGGEFCGESPFSTSAVYHLHVGP
ncbi:hypothetical protein ACNOYE_25140 [Nannocystaceae bacterium ST9]